MQRDDVLRLLTRGQDFGGWKSARVRRSMTQCAGGFELEVSQLWPGQAKQQRIAAGDECRVLIGGEPVITGYIDVVDATMDARAHDVQIAGRDKTADLVDCSAVRKTGQWKGATVERIAADLAEPFGVRVLTEVDTGKALPSFALQEGETVYDTIERAARIRALLLVTDTVGNLVITRAGVRRVATPLVLGSNLLQMRASVDLRDRYSSYVIKGQAPGSDFASGSTVAQIRAKADDPAVPRYRPLVLTNDAPDLAATLSARATWEANVRAARSCGVQAVVQGWRHAEGLWEPNTRVQVVAPDMLLDDELLITSVDYELSDRGQVARLELTRPDAYQLLPLKDAKLQPWWDDERERQAALDRLRASGGAR